MLVAGMTCGLTGVAYYFLTQDAPEGNFRKLRAEGKLPPGKYAAGAFLKASADYRVWLLALIYGACFGIELTIDNIAAIYFVDHFGLGLESAGFAAAAFGMMNLFARMLGGVIGDRFGAKWGLQGRTTWLFIVLLCEGIGLMLFSQAQSLYFAIPLLMGFGLFVKMSNGATYSVTPFINRNAMGAVAGIVGAGGNIGAVAAGFLFKGGLDWSTCLLLLGICVASISFLAFGIRFSPELEPLSSPSDSSGVPLGAVRKPQFRFKRAPADVV
jgi:MFS transporter, NNP family, nitrate/nitrite transporter